MIQATAGSVTGTQPPNSTLLPTRPSLTLRTRGRTFTRWADQHRIMETPSLARCLAYAALSDYGSWLGRPSPRDLELLLAGACARVELTSTRLEEWRIYGPLEDPNFYMPLVARTGHPTLSIKWSSALEFLHLDLEAAVRELMALLENWNGTLSVAADPRGFLAVEPNRPSPTLHEFLRQVARRPGMFWGATDGWALRCYL